MDMAKGPRQKTSDLPEHIRAVASTPGRVVCLRCQKKFVSPDRVRVRICNRCTPLNDALFVRAEVDAKFDVYADP
jgi:hypothetical protein